MKVIISDPAEADLEAIADWIAIDNPRRAVTFVGELVKACRGLSSHPNRFSFARGISGRTIRQRNHGDYLIFFEVDPARSSVVVLRVLHGARDHRAIFRPDEDPS